MEAFVVRKGGLGDEKILPKHDYNFDIVREIMVFLMEHKLYSFIPMVAILVLFGCLMVFASASEVGPFIYTLF